MRRFLKKALSVPASIAALASVGLRGGWTCISSRLPDQLILFSPAIGVAPWAFMARRFGRVPFVEKANWVAVEVEYDPFFERVEGQIAETVGSLQPRTTAPVSAP